MIIASAIVIMTTVITVVLMTMTMITKLGHRGPGALRAGKERVDSAQQWRSLALLALGGPQLISTSSLFILVTVFRPTHLPQVQFGKNSLILESQRNF